MLKPVQTNNGMRQLAQRSYTSLDRGTDASLSLTKIKQKVPICFRQFHDKNCYLSFEYPIHNAKKQLCTMKQGHLLLVNIEDVRRIVDDVCLTCTLH